MAPRPWRGPSRCGRDDRQGSGDGGARARSCSFERGSRTTLGGPARPRDRDVAPADLHGLRCARNLPVQNCRPARTHPPRSRLDCSVGKMRRAWSDRTEGGTHQPGGGDRLRVAPRVPRWTGRLQRRAPGRRDGRWRESSRHPGSDLGPVAHPRKGGRADRAGPDRGASWLGRRETVDVAHVGVRGARSQVISGRRFMAESQAERVMRSSSTDSSAGFSTRMTEISSQRRRLRDLEEEAGLWR